MLTTSSHLLVLQILSATSYSKLGLVQVLQCVVFAQVSQPGIKASQVEQLPFARKTELGWHVLHPLELEVHE